LPNPQPLEKIKAVFLASSKKAVPPFLIWNIFFSRQKIIFKSRRKAVFVLVLKSKTYFK